MSPHHLIFFLLSLAYSSKLVEYKFGTYFGEIFYDSSGNGNHGQNGASISTTVGNTVPTDRGAYFKYSTDSYIKLPPNEVKTTSLSLTSTFSIVMWVLVLDLSNYYLTYRGLDSTKYIYIERKDYGNYLLSRLVKPNFDSTAEAGTQYFGEKQWRLVALINQDASCKIYLDGVSDITITQTSSYSETGSYLHFIGYTSNSLEGLVWSYYVYDEVVILTNFYTSSYNGANCLVETCGSSCTPGIVENGISYCLATSTYTSYSGTGSYCYSCSYGCTTSTCLSCSVCSSKACSISGSIKSCFCSSGSLTGATCTCSSGYYLSASGYDCSSCYGECATCSDQYICDTCKDVHSTEHLSIGCTCNSGYYNTTALVNGGTCLKCYEECLTCSAVLVCLTCKDTHSTKHSTVGCTCNSGYYNSTALINGGTCLQCYGECLTCSSQYICLTCAALFSTSHSTYGCTCSSGYYNTTALINGGTCIECYGECSTCSDALKCLTCKDIHSTAHLSIGCTCNSGYYNNTALINGGTCLECFKDCETCKENFLCLSCKSSNSIFHKTLGCICEEKHFNRSELTTNQACIPCYIECKACSDELVCDECIDSNSSPSPTVGCECNDGFYNLAQLISDGNCLKCRENCSLCESDEKCLECQYKYMNIENGSCSCPINSYLINDICTANEGYYIESRESINYTQECHPSCKSCNGPGEGACDTCANNLTMANRLCNTCNISEYLENYACYNCPDECFTCQNSSHCLTCSNLSKTVVAGECLFDCGLEFYSLGDKCDRCQELCLVCVNFTDCLVCKNNSNLTSGKCLCSDGLIVEENECVRKFFKGGLSISKSNLASILFTESVSVSLKAENFTFQIENRSDFEVSLLKNRLNKDLLFSLVFKNSVTSGTKIEVMILIDDLRSVTGAYLENYILSAELSEYNTPYSNSIAEIPSAATKTSVTIGVSSSVCASIISNPAAVWALLNTIQLLAFLPLNSNPLPPDLAKFLTGVRDLNIIPNLFDKFYPPNTSSQPYLEARRYGITTSVFVLNIGPNLVLFLAITCFWPFAAFLSKCASGKFASKLIKLLGNYKFSFFLRFWTQMYLEIGIYAIIQLKASANNWPGYLNQGISTICAIGVALTPIITILAGYFSYSQIKVANREFLKKWGSLYSEFKNDKGFWSSQYYFFYFSRRLAYLISQVYINEHIYLQGGIHVFCSLALIAFLFYYKPFKSFGMLCSNLISELGTLIIIALSYGFNFNIQVKTKEVLELVIMFTILSTIFLQFIISMIVLVGSMISLWEKYLKKRNLQIARKAEIELDQSPEALNK